MQDFGNLDNSVSICDPDTFRLHATASPKLQFVLKQNSRRSHSKTFKIIS